MTTGMNKAMAARHATFQTYLQALGGYSLQHDSKVLSAAVGPVYHLRMFFPTFVCLVTFRERPGYPLATPEVFRSAVCQRPLFLTHCGPHGTVAQCMSVSFRESAVLARNCFAVLSDDYDAECMLHYTMAKHINRKVVNQVRWHTVLLELKGSVSRDLEPGLLTIGIHNLIFPRGLL